MRLLRSSLVDRRYVVWIFLLVIMLGVTVTDNYQVKASEAEELNLNQVLEKAVDKTSQLDPERKSVSDLEREIAKLKANAGWQYDLNFSYNRREQEQLPVSNEQEQLSGINQNGSAQSTEINDNYNLSIDGGRSFLSGLNLSTDLTLIDASDLDFDQIADEWELNLGLNYRLWPRSPSSMERSLKDLENNLELARLELEAAEEEFILGLIEDYLEIMFLIKKQDNNLENLKIVERRLARVEERKELGEAGELELKESKLAVKQAERAYQSTERNLDRLKTNFKKQTGIDDSINYNLSAEVESLLINNKAALNERINSYFNDFSVIIKDRQSNSLEYERLLQSLLKAEEELEWFDTEDTFEMNLSASREVNDGNWQAGFSISYPLYDGGVSSYEREELAAEIANINSNLEELSFNLEQGLEAELNDLINQLGDLEDKEIEKDMSQLKLLQEEEAREIGAIGDLELLEAELNYDNSIINYNEARLGLALNLLKFEQKLGYWNMEEIVNE
ncbi:MAG: TolC family protein [Halarsenatibacteraceae bacterium]